MNVDDERMAGLKYAIRDVSTTQIIVNLENTELDGDDLVINSDSESDGFPTNHV
jgi:hypothetical protein